jgi:hypothetical protein
VCPLSSVCTQQAPQLELLLLLLLLVVLLTWVAAPQLQQQPGTPLLRRAPWPRAHASCRAGSRQQFAEPPPSRRAAAQLLHITCS